jgi:hypothetical protein
MKVTDLFVTEVHVHFGVGSGIEPWRTVDAVFLIRTTRQARVTVYNIPVNTWTDVDFVMPAI